MDLQFHDLRFTCSRADGNDVAVLEYDPLFGQLRAVMESRIRQVGDPFENPFLVWIGENPELRLSSIPGTLSRKASQKASATIQFELERPFLSGFF